MERTTTGIISTERAIAALKPIWTVCNAFDWLRIATKTVLKITRTIPIMETHQATRVRVQLDEPMISQLDGDATGDVVAIDARVRPDALKIQTPAAAVPDSLAAPAMTEDDAEVVKD